MRRREVERFACLALRGAPFFGRDTVASLLSSPFNEATERLDKPGLCVVGDRTSKKAELIFDGRGGRGPANMHHGV